MAPNQHPRLTDEQLGEVLGLMAGADSVELKVTIPASEHRETLAKLDIDPLDAQIRQVYFFDTPDLALNHAGVVVRSRRIQGKGEDSTVKLRPVVPADLSADLRKSPNMVVEVDALPGGFMCSASMKRPAAALGVRDVVSGKKPIRKLFTKEQRAFYKANAPAGIELDALSILGPISVFKVKFNPVELGQKLVAELWMYPDYSRILELSTKAAPADAIRVAAEGRVFMAKRGVDLGGDQQTKTMTALEFFAGRVTKNADATEGAEAAEAAEAAGEAAEAAPEPEPADVPG